MTTSGSRGDGGTAYEQIVGTRFGRYLSGREKQAITRALQLGPERGVAADIGCDGGRWSRYLMENGYSVFCTDVDEASLALCKRRLPESVCILTSPQAEGFPFKDGQLDLVLCIGVVEVILADWFAAEARRVLRPGGLLVASVPNRDSWRSVLAKTVRSQKQWAPHYTLSYTEFRAGMVEHGFSFEQEIGVRWLPVRRSSDSPAVPFLAWVEKYLGFSRLTRYSPWVIVTARRDH